MLNWQLSIHILQNPSTYVINDQFFSFQSQKRINLYLRSNHFFHLQVLKRSGQIMVAIILLVPIVYVLIVWVPHEINNRQITNKIRHCMNTLEISDRWFTNNMVIFIRKQNENIDVDIILILFVWHHVSS